jgi:glucose dehydrogenase
MFSAYAPKAIAQKSSSDWPMFHADPSHSGAGTGNPALTPTLLWNYTTGGTIESSPAVVNSVVYIGSFDGNVYALNATNGDKIWNHTTGKHVYSSPAVVGGVVYVGSGDGNVYALNATNGALFWKYTTGNLVDSSPTVVNGVVYVGSDNGRVYALGLPTSSSPASSKPLFIIIGAVVAVVTVASMIFLMFPKGLKIKPKSSR